MIAWLPFVFFLPQVKPTSIADTLDLVAYSPNFNHASSNIHSHYRATNRCVHCHTT
jgi:hypothetical protein